MRRRGNDNNSAVADNEFADAVHHDQAANSWPARAGFGSELGQPRLDLRFIGFILELVDAAIEAIESKQRFDGAASRLCLLVRSK